MQINDKIYVVILFMWIMGVVVRNHKYELVKINDFMHVDYPGIEYYLAEITYFLPHK